MPSNVCKYQPSNSSIPVTKPLTKKQVRLVKKVLGNVLYDLETGTFTRYHGEKTARRLNF